MRARFNHAVHEELLDGNPSCKLTRNGRGRAEQVQPTKAEFDPLLVAPKAHRIFAARRQ